MAAPDTRTVCKSCGNRLESHGLDELRFCKRNYEGRVKWHMEQLRDNAERRALEDELGVLPAVQPTPTPEAR